MNISIKFRAVVVCASFFLFGGICDAADDKRGECESEFLNIVLLIEARKDIWDILKADQLPNDKEHYSICDVAPPVEDFFEGHIYRALRDQAGGVVFFERVNIMNNDDSYLFGPYRYPNPKSALSIIRDSS